MNKSFRHGQIVKIVRSQEVFTQDELARELQKVGIAATQVTLSRDIRELGLVKTGEGYQQITAESTGPDLETIAAEFLLDVRTAQNLVILKTLPAHASVLAIALDQEEWPEVVGTVAGDDTVLVVAPDGVGAVALESKLMAMVRDLHTHRTHQRRDA